MTEILDAVISKKEDAVISKKDNEKLFSHYFNLVNASKPLHTASAWFQLTFLCLFFVHAFPCLGSYGKGHVFELQIPGLVCMEAWNI